MPARMRHLRYRDLDGLARDRLDRTKSNLALGLSPGSKPEYVFTADNLTNRLTITGEDTLAVGFPRVILTGAIPAELKKGTLYFLGDGGLNLYALYPTKGDAIAATNAVAFTTNGTGTLTLTILE